MSENPSMADHPDLAEVKQAHDLQELRARYDWAAEAPLARALEGLMILAGLYIALSGWIVGFSGPLAVNNLVVGLAVAVLGFSFAIAYGGTHRVAWVCPVLGVWTIVALWAVSGAVTSMGSILSNVIAGAVVLLVGLTLLTTARGSGTPVRMLRMGKARLSRRGATATRG